MKVTGARCEMLVLAVFAVILTFSACKRSTQDSDDLTLNNQGYFETRGLNVMVFNSWYNGLFIDSKMSGIEIIHHEIRTATNGDVKLSPTPDQWDPVPEFINRVTDPEKKSIEAFLKYPAFGMNYSVKVESVNGGIRISVYLEKPLPDQLVGKAGFNLEFLPSAFFEKGYLMDSIGGIFPIYPAGEMEVDGQGRVEPLPMAKGRTLVLAPEDPLNRITIRSDGDELLLYDGRNKAQNGWFVLRSTIPSGKSGKVIEWYLTANTIDDWQRPAVVAYSQVGYHPGQKKQAVVELDVNTKPYEFVSLLKVNPDGQFIEKLKGDMSGWGRFLRYNYYIFDFSTVKDPGLYVIEYNKKLTGTFRISKDVYNDAWYPTLDVFFPVQMDHMYVKEAYRVWHGAAHLDDALQAPVNHVHFDMYAQGPSTDTWFKPGEHIPGLNRGGWFDAGDFDIRTQTQYAVVLSLVQTWELFRPERDETTIDQRQKYVKIHVPDGKPDMLQQIEHGTLALIGQFRSVGHAINGIIASRLTQYTLLGDASTSTDNMIYNPNLDSLENNGFTSGKFDDRWAFTTKSTPLDYGSAAALAAAGRVLKGYNDPLSKECLKTAEKVWNDEHSHAPDLFIHGNTTGGKLEAEELKAAAELLISTQDEKYASRIEELWPYIEQNFFLCAIPAAKVKPLMNEFYAKRLRELVVRYADTLPRLSTRNPYGVPVTTGGWAGNGYVVWFAVTNYFLHRAFPDIIDPEYVYRGLDYIYGCHPASNISFVSGVGTHSKKIAYGYNRADYSFIAGGVVPGVLILPPDFPENKEDWPFLWGENEYVVSLAANYIFLVNAVRELLQENK